MISVAVVPVDMTFVTLTSSHPTGTAEYVTGTVSCCMRTATSPVPPIHNLRVGGLKTVESLFVTAKADTPGPSGIGATTC